MKVLIASFCPCTRKSCTQLAANGKFLMDQFLLLLPEINDLAIINIEHFICPKCTAGMNIHIEFVWNESACDCELSLLLAQ